MDEEKIVSLAGMRDKTKVSKQKPEKAGKIVKSEQETVYCSFCHRPNNQVIKMVQGPGVNICSECTMIAVQYLILENKLPTGEAQAILDSFWNRAR